MAYDYSILFDKIIVAVSHTGSVTERMKLVIDECARQRPHPDWAELSKIDFEGDATTLNDWLAAAFAGADPNESRIGLWFGLFNPADEHGEASADMYVGASPGFATNSLDWARNIEELRSSNYLNSSVLKAIYSIAYRSPDGLSNDAEYPLVLAYGAIAAHSLLSENALPAALQGLKGAAIGFDSGDLLFLGEFDASRFFSNVRAG